MLYEQKTPTFEKTENTKQRHTENPGNRRIHPRLKKKKERTPLTPHCTDPAQTSTTVTGRPSPVDLFSVRVNGAPTKRYEGKTTKNS